MNIGETSYLPMIGILLKEILDWDDWMGFKKNLVNVRKAKTSTFELFVQSDINDFHSYWTKIHKIIFNKYELVNQ
jgi:hypothetical protein